MQIRLVVRLEDDGEASICICICMFVGEREGGQQQMVLRGRGSWKGILHCFTNNRSSGTVVMQACVREAREPLTATTGIGALTVRS